MEVVSFKIDSRLKKKMKQYKDINWSEILREAVEKRLILEEFFRNTSFDVKKALKASSAIDTLRTKTSGSWSGEEEIKHWRTLHK